VTAFLFLFTLLSGPSRADPPPVPPRELGFADAAVLALDDNADLQAIRSQEEALNARARQALAPNNPVLAYEKIDLPGPSPLSEPGSTSYSVSYTLGFPGKALSQSALLRHQAEAAARLSLGREIDILTALSDSYAALAANQKSAQVFAEEERRAEELQALLEKKLAAAQASQVDLLNAKVALAGLRQDILTNRHEQAKLVTAFLNLIHRSGSPDLRPRIPDEIPVPSLALGLEELRALMLRNAPALLAARKQVEASDAALAGAWLAPLPDLQLNAAMTIYKIPAAEALPGISRTYSMGIGVSLPIFYPFNELSGTHAARMDLSAAEAQAESQRLSSLAGLQDTFADLGAARQELENLASLVQPAAKSAYDLARLAYSLGRADYFVLNQARQAWIQAQKDVIARKLAAARLYDQLVDQVGCDFSNPEGPHACR
jgi:outer membrane protein